MSETIHDVVIVGSGPAGYTAAIYTARAGFKPVVVAGALAAGGALMNTTEVENFPGFPEGVLGPELMDNMRQQAEKFGADIRYEDAYTLELEGDIKKITLEEGKPEHIVPKIVQGRLEAFYKDNCLVDQAFARDPSKSVGQVLREAGAKVTQFVRVHVGA